jgi:uncharacterized protein YeaO (DUF488 family)
LIKTKSIYDKKEESDGKRISITRYYPRGITKDNFDFWYRDLSPSRDLLKSLKQGVVSRSVFFQFFCKDLRSDEKKLELCKQLAIESINKNITLLCFEEEEIFCHRYYVKKICENELAKLEPARHDKCRNNLTNFL